MGSLTPPLSLLLESFQIVEKGTDPNAEQAALNKDVKCHFKGMLTNNTVFDASHARGEGAMQVPVTHTLPGYVDHTLMTRILYLHVHSLSCSSSFMK